MTRCLLRQGDLDIFSLDLHAGIQACMSVRLARTVRQTDEHTHAHTNNAKTITPSTDVGCNDLGGVKGKPRNQGRLLHTGCVWLESPRSIWGAPVPDLRNMKYLPTKIYNRLYNSCYQSWTKSVIWRDQNMQGQWNGIQKILGISKIISTSFILNFTGSFIAQILRTWVIISRQNYLKSIKMQLDIDVSPPAFSYTTFTSTCRRLAPSVPWPWYVKVSGPKLKYFQRYEFFCSLIFLSSYRRTDRQTPSDA